MSEETAMYFPQGFLWGSATSAHQVEGNCENNQWWAWEAEPGHTWQGQRSGLACDWWERGEEDLTLAAGQGQNAHRFSIEWSRVEPQEGVFDQQALERYRRLLLHMRELGMEPMATLHHFTHPRWLEAQGGWLNPETVERFERYVDHTAAALGDLVHLWCPVNEPMVYATSSYLRGIWPPGRRSLGEALRALKHLLLGHAAAYHALHRLWPEAEVGLVPHLRLFDPARPSSPLDRAVAGLLDYAFNRLPVLAAVDGHLRFPLTLGGLRVPALAGSFDFIGVNYYTRDLVAFDLRRPGELFGRRFYAEGERNDPGWHDDFGEIYPEGLYRCLIEYARYGKPLYVTETGWADAADSRRPRALLTHVAQVWRAIEAGAPVRGFFHWTLVDNFEWAEGWRQRFGLIELDPASQARRPRRSAEVYAAIARTNGITRELVERFAPEALEQIFGR